MFQPGLDTKTGSSAESVVKKACCERDFWGIAEQKWPEFKADLRDFGIEERQIRALTVSDIQIHLSPNCPENTVNPGIGARIDVGEDCITQSLYEKPVECIDGLNLRFPF